jgi:signal peptidase I
VEAPRAFARPLTAAALALVCPGLGHLYLGRPTRAFACAGLGWLALCLVPLGVSAYEELAQAVLAAGVLLGASYWVLQLLLAVRLARARADRPARPRAYQRFVGYFAFAAFTLAGFGGVALLVRAHVLELFLVPTGSMLPGLHPGDLVFVPKLGPGARPLQRGDLVVFEAPYLTLPEPWVKRVVAFPGEEVGVQGGRLVLPGQEVFHRKLAEQGLRRPLPASRRPRELLQETTGRASYAILLSPNGPDPEADAERFDREPIQVPAGHLYVLGDARLNSRDSRNFGPVPFRRLIGRVGGVLWP